MPSANPAKSPACSPDCGTRVASPARCPGAAKILLGELRLPAPMALRRSQDEQCESEPVPHARHYGGTLTKGLPRSRNRRRRCWSRDRPMRVLTWIAAGAPPRSSHSRSLVHRSSPDSSRPMPSAAHTPSRPARQIAQPRPPDVRAHERRCLRCGSSARISTAAPMPAASAARLSVRQAAVHHAHVGRAARREQRRVAGS